MPLNRRYSIAPVGLFLLLLSSVLLYVSFRSRNDGVQQQVQQQQGLRKLSLTAAAAANQPMQHGSFQDPRSVQLKMSQMQTQTTDGTYAAVPQLTSQQSDAFNRLSKPYSPADSAMIETNYNKQQPMQQQQNFPIIGAKEAMKLRLKESQRTIIQEPLIVEQDRQRQKEEAAKPKVRTNVQLEKQRMQKLLYSRNKNILTLGGSTTWGSKLEERTWAYPYLLPQLLGSTWKVYNLAVRATDASYASQCIETMVREGNKQKNKQDVLEFDVIMLEYSLNGLDGMPLLLKRLRQRYPKAVILYVHLWSLRMSVDNAVTGAKPRDELTKGLKFKDADANINAMLADPNAKWAWGPKMKSDSEAIRDAALRDVEAVGGHLYQVPMPDESPQVAFEEHWFGPDYHHLSRQGHAMVAEQLAALLLADNEAILNSAGSRIGDVQKTDIHQITLGATAAELGTWGAGDHCYSWYETGTHPDVQVDGGTVKNFVKNDKWAVNVGLTFGQPAIITFPNTKDQPQPVMLMIMSWGPGVYPKAKIDLRSPGFVGNQTSILDPLHSNPLHHVFHVTRTAHIGWANADSSSKVTVDPIEDVQRPLRVIGIVMCGACLEMDPTYLDNDATHQRLGGTMPYPELESKKKKSGDAENGMTEAAQEPLQQQQQYMNFGNNAPQQQQQTPDPYAVQVQSGKFQAALSKEDQMLQQQQGQQQQDPYGTMSNVQQQQQQGLYNAISNGQQQQPYAAMTNGQQQLQQQDPYSAMANEQQQPYGTVANGQEQQPIDQPYGTATNGEQSNRAAEVLKGAMPPPQEDEEPVAQIMRHMQQQQQPWQQQGPRNMQESSGGQHEYSAAMSQTSNTSMQQMQTQPMQHQGYQLQQQQQGEHTTAYNILQQEQQA